MKPHELTGPIRRARKRVGRGLAAGQGKTAGRGTKGQHARAGFNLPRRFEGGQSSLIQRLPKRKGFRGLAKKPVAVRIDRVLARMSQEKITLTGLAAAGFLTQAETKAGLVKLTGTVTTRRSLKLGKGISLTKKLAQQLGIIR